MEWYLAVLKKFSVFTGRSRRKEYWMFFLFNFLIGIGFSILSLIPGIGFLFRILSVIYMLAVLLPGIAVGIRRLHDTNRTGWLLLLGLIPLVGFIILIVFTVEEGTPGDNQYGPNPKT